jgi:elongation factor Ts
VGVKISIDLIKELREITSSSVAHCKKALEETKGDIKKAAVLLRKQGLEIAAKKQSRLAKEGSVCASWQ